MSSRSTSLRYALPSSHTLLSPCSNMLTCFGTLQHTSGNKKAEEDANQDAEKQIKGITAAGKKGQQKVVDDLLKAIFDVQPVVPENIKA